MNIRLLLAVVFILCESGFSQYTGEFCTVENTNAQGTCKSVYDCPAVMTTIREKLSYTRCGFEGRNEIVCCSDPISVVTSTKAPEIDGNSPVHQQKCKEYSESIYEYVYSIALSIEAEPNKIKVDKCGHKIVQLVVGGEQAQAKEFPHMALVGFSIYQNQVSWSCGGTLISDQFVLTAGHCLHTRQLGDPKYIRLGDLDILSEDDDAQPETFNITEIIQHPEYRIGSKYNDIGLLKMDRKVKFNAYIRPACLPTVFDGPEKQAIATGWGHTEWAGMASSLLQKVTVTKFSQVECNRTYTSQIGIRLRDGIREETQICAGSKTARKDTCQGDSGGPLQVFHPHLYCMYTVIGVTSFGITCGNIGIPGVYTRVYPYVEWIENNVWKN